jgi:hypothetical protein
MLEEVEKNRTLLIKQWFSNLVSGVNNTGITLVLEDSKGYLYENLISILPKTELGKQSRHEVFDIEKYLSYPHLINSKNGILILPSDKSKIPSDSLRINKLLQNSLLFIPSENPFYSNMSEHISQKSDNLIAPLNLKKNERYLYYIENVSSYELLIENRNFVWINNYIETMLDTCSIFWNAVQVKTIIAQGTTFKHIYNINDFSHDISLLVNKNLLTSRFSAILYRLSTLDVEADITKTGRYFHKKSGSKSKLYTVKSGISLIYSICKVINRKSLKAYDLSINESEMAIREEIAIKLINLDIEKLDIKIIADITGFPRGGLKN